MKVHALLLASALTATTASAQNPVAQERFDGAYAGDVRINAATSAEGCRAGGPVSITVSEGRFDTAAPALDARLAGFVTTDGFVKAEAVFENGARAPLEGRIIGGVFSAGLVTDGAQRCVYILKLGA